MSEVVKTVQNFEVFTEVALKFVYRFEYLDLDRPKNNYAEEQKNQVPFKT